MTRANTDDDVGMSPLKALQNVWQKVDRDRKRGSNLQGSSTGRLRFMNSLAGHRSRPQEQFRVRAKGATRVGNDQPTPGARKQPYSKRLLQCLDAGAHCRLTDAQCFRGAMKAAKCCHREKGLNLIDFHVPPVRRFSS